MRRKETNDRKVCTGWAQKWISPNQIRKNKDLDIREVVRGPFSSPKLLTTQPIITVPSRRQITNVNEHYNKLQHGIPDTWKEYLVRKGCCDSVEECVQQKNVISCFVRSFATERIWNELGLPLVQGIPDPWRCKFLFQRRPAKCLRRRAHNDNNSTQTAYIYDGDDEAEIEHSVKRQFNEDHVVNKKDLSQEEDKESRQKRALRTRKNNLKEVKKHDDQLPLDKKLKLTSQHRKLRNDVNTKINRTEKPISNSRTRNKKRLPTSKNEIQTNEKLGNKKPKERVHIDTKNEIENRFGCCKCPLQNHVYSNAKNYSEHASPLQGINASNLVLCQNCENIYYNKNPQQLNATMTNIPISNTPNALQHKTINEQKTDKRSRFEGEKGCFENDNHIKTRNKISVEELKLVCGLCNNPYLKIEPIRTGNARRRSSDTCNKKERNKIKNSMARKQCRNIGKNSENCHCTCTGNKMHVSRGGLGQTPCSTKRGDNVLKRNSCGNNAIAKDVSGMKIDENIKVGTKDGIGAEDIVKVHEVKTNPRNRRYKREVLEDNGKKRMRRRESANKSDTTIADEKSKVKQFQQQVRFDSILNYVVSDSGEYADISDDFIDDSTNVTPEDRLSVTSTTFIQHLDSAIPMRKLYRRLKLHKTYRIHQEMSRPSLIDFEQVLKIEDLTNCDRNDIGCDTLHCVGLDNNGNGEIERVN